MANNRSFALLDVKDWRNVFGSNALHVSDGDVRNALDEVPVAIKASLGARWKSRKNIILLSVF